MQKNILSGKYIGLQAKVSIAVIMTTVVILSLSFFVSNMYDRKEHLEQMKNSAIILSKSLERSIIASNSFHDPEKLQQLVVDFNKIEGVNEVYVFDKDYKILAHPKKEKIGHLYTNPDAVEALKYDRISTEFKTPNEEEGQLYDVVTPVHENNQVIGAIEVELSMNNLNKLQESSLNRGVLTIILNFLAIGVILVVLLFKIVVNPIQQLAQVTGEIAKGNFNLSLQSKQQKDEISDLTRAFQKMLEALSELRLKDKSANPLTGLPGNIDITEEIKRRIEADEKFAALYLDLDNFKAFNDYYGFFHGDQALKYTAAVIQDAVAVNGSNDDFIGHIGGDDFVVICSVERAVDLAKVIISKFDSDSQSLYKEEDRQRGYIEIEDRSGNKNHFSFITISIAIVDNVIIKIENPLELAEIAAELKHLAKNQEGSTYAVNRRKSRRH